CGGFCSSSHRSRSVSFLSERGFDLTASIRGSGPLAVVGPVPGAVARRCLRLVAFRERCLQCSSALGLSSGIVILRCCLVESTVYLNALAMSYLCLFAEVAVVGQHNYL